MSDGAEAGVPQRPRSGNDSIDWTVWAPWFAVLLALVLDAGMQEAYFRLGLDWPRVALLLMMAGLSAAMIARGRPTATVWVWAPTATALSLMVPFHSATAAWLAGPTPIWTGLKALIVFIALAVLGLRAKPELWHRLRQAITAAILIFAGSGPLLALALAHSVPWLKTPPSNRADREATVFILLDELNWKAAAPIIAAVHDAGFDVRARPLTAIGDATARVIPEMITREHFSKAAACLPTAICSEGRILDFSRVGVGPGVDVVGFYHPYCSIPGLRSCLVTRPASPAFDMRRWRCALARRLPGSSDGEFLDRCAGLAETVARDHLQALVAAVDQAPVWAKGGVLYAHLPLPHPPGIVGHGSLPEQYRGNVAMAAQVVERIARRLISGGFTRTRLIIFSDHPLRPAVWCRLPSYEHNGCPLPASEMDDHVPLIAAGFADWRAFDRMSSNAGIFDLAAAR
jgi:hypothetical protein